MKKFLVDIGDSLYSGKFRAETNNTKVILFHSKRDKGWTEKVSGKAAVLLEDDGNGVLINFKNGHAFHLDYSQLAELRALLNIHDDAYVFKGHKPTSFRKQYIK